MTTETTVTGAGAATPAKKTRNRIKEQVILQSDARQTSSGGPEWLDLAGTPPFDDTAAALKWLKDKQKTGKFRIIAVKKTVSVEIETKTAVKIK